MEKQGLLIGAYWFTAYITFFAVMSLCMFALGNVNDSTVGDTLTAAVKGRGVFVRLASGSVSAARCVTSLGVRTFPLISSIVLIREPKEHRRPNDNAIESRYPDSVNT